MPCSSLSRSALAAPDDKILPPDLRQTSSVLNDRVLILRGKADDTAATEEQVRPVSWDVLFPGRNQEV